MPHNGRTARNPDAHKSAMKMRQRMPASARPQIAYIVTCIKCQDIEVVQTQRGGQNRLTPETIDEYMLRKNWLVTPAGYVCVMCVEHGYQFLEYMKEKITNVTK